MASSNYPDPTPTDLLSSIATFHLLTSSSPAIYHTLIARLDRMAENAKSRAKFLSLFAALKADNQRRVYELCFQDSRIRNTAKHLALLWPHLDKGLKMEFWADRFTPEEREMVVSHTYWEAFNDNAAACGMKFDPEKEAHAS